MKQPTGTAYVSNFLKLALIFIIFCSLPTLLYANGPEVYELAPGVVVDRASSAIYTMHQDRSVEALDLENGNQLWISDAAEKPLWVDGNTVFAQFQPSRGSPGLHVVSLNANDGQTRGDNLTIPLLDGVRPNIDAARGKTFSVHLQGENGILSAQWDYLDQSSMPKPFADAPAAKIRIEKGAALLDTSSMAVEVVSPDLVSSRSRAPSAVGALLDAGSLKEPYWLAETLVTSISDLPMSNGNREVKLQRWEAATGTVLKELTLYEGQVLSRMAASDQQHILLVSRTGEAINGIHQYRWSIFSLLTGEPAGEVVMGRSATPFSLIDGNLLHVLPPFGHLVEGQWVEEPPKVRLLDLQSGEVLWARPIRDTIYRGPVPSTLREH